MEKIQHNIERISAAANANDAFEAFTKSMNEFGYDRVAYTLCTDHPSLNLPKQHGLSTSYPADWMNHYVDNSFLKVDPIVKELLNKRTPFFWDEVIKKQDKDNPAFQLMMDAEDAGVGDGIGISFETPQSEITGIGLARSERYSYKQSYEDIAAIYLITSYFHETYRNFILPKETVALNHREKDILAWAAEGKIDEDIAQNMGLSVHTVHYNWKNISNKLNTFNRTHAVSKALRLGLIMPGLITY